MSTAFALWAVLMVGAAIGYWLRGWADAQKRAYQEDE